MSLKKKYYTMSNEEFKQYLKQLKEDKDCISIFDKTNTPYFYTGSYDINNLIIELNKVQIQLDSLYNSFSDVQKKMIEQTCFIDEIQSTNQTENIYSTRTDIFGVMNEVELVRNKKIV